MNDLAAWHKTNDDYLSAAISWLRLRLMHLTKAHEDDDAETLEGARSAMQQLASTDPPPALLILSQRLGLARFETDVLLLCAAMEFDTRIAALCTKAQNDITRPYPTFALALALFDEPVWEALSPERPLRFWQLIEINQPAAQTLTVSALRADERVVSYIKGLNYLDDRLKTLIIPMTDAIDILPPSQLQQAEKLLQSIQALPSEWPMVNLVGVDSASKRAIANYVTRSIGLICYRLSAELLPTAWAELETFVRLYQRESYLLPLALYLEIPDTDKVLPVINRLLTRLNGLVLLDTREPYSSTERSIVSLDITKPTSAEQAAIWRQMLGNNTSSTADVLAGQFNLNVADIRHVTYTLLNTTLPAKTEAPAIQEDAWQACLLAARPRLDALAQRLEVKARRWEDLVLPDAEINTVQQIINQVDQRHHVYERWGFGRRMTRGLGISALFSGESGTGKTLAAEVIAHRLKLDLYRIDLSQVVSKYIGETEKNLRRLFDAAEDGGAILFFDEADALFGKRSEVKDSHDRYANIEINYLLQRMEAFRGLAILASNMKNALDTAFMRRLRFIVNFPFPGLAERKRIWERVFPEEADKEILDYDRLARFNLTGGSIQNIAINAAFLAASTGCVITMPLIFEAIRGEFRKLEKPINEAEFRFIQAVEIQA